MIVWFWPTLCVQDRVPFQYLIASAHWRQHILAVGPGVLIPRPETEIFAGGCGWV
jgi:release factor glutamine methyltransferase